MSNQSWGQIRYGKNAPTVKTVLTPEQRDAIVSEARQLREENPSISRYEVSRVLAVKYSVTGRYVRDLID